MFLFLVIVDVQPLADLIELEVHRHQHPDDAIDGLAIQCRFAALPHPPMVPPSSCPTQGVRSGLRRCRLGRFGPLEDEPAFSRLNPHRVSGFEPTFEQLERERVLDEPLDRAF